MNNDLNHNLVLRRNGNTIKTTFHGARQREAVHVDVRARIQSCACTLREGFEWNAFRIMRHVRIPRVRLREGNVRNKWALAFRL